MENENNDTSVQEVSYEVGNDGGRGGDGGRGAPLMSAIALARELGWDMMWPL